VAWALGASRWPRGRRFIPRDDRCDIGSRSKHPFKQDVFDNNGDPNSKRPLNEAARQSLRLLKSASISVIGLLGFLYPVTLRAQVSAQVRIVVSDAENKAPIPLARITLAGPRRVLTVTGADGTAIVRRLPPGQYFGVVGKPGYIGTAIPAFTVGHNQNLTLSVTLSRSRRIIATVASTSSARPKALVTQDQADSKIEGSLGRALVDNPYIDAARGSMGVTSPSIDGHNPSETAFSVNGLPFAPFGGPPAIRAIPLDLFGGADVSQAEGTAGGAIDFQIPEPTLAFDADGRAESLSSGAYSETGYARGTAGYLGYSVGLTDRAVKGPLDGQSFLDESGKVYAHDQASATAGAIVKVRIPTSGDSSLNFFGLSSRYTSPDQCDHLIGLEPCGYGPGNKTSQSLSSFQVRETSFSDRYSYEAAFFGSSEKVVDDQEARVFQGTPEPFLTSYSASLEGFAVDASQVTTHLHQFGFEFRRFVSENNGNANLAGSCPAPWCMTEPSS
jgi:hypothetical protein